MIIVHYFDKKNMYQNYAMTFQNYIMMYMFWKLILY